MLFYYYPTALHREQIMPKTSANNTRYLYSRGPVRNMPAQTLQFGVFSVLDNKSLITRFVV